MVHYFIFSYNIDYKVICLKFGEYAYKNPHEFEALKANCKQIIGKGLQLPCWFLSMAGSGLIVEALFILGIKKMGGRSRVEEWLRTQIAYVGANDTFSSF